MLTCTRFLNCLAVHSKSCRRTCREGRRMEHGLYLDLHLRSYISIDKIFLRWHSWHGPAVEPFGGLWRHIDTTVTVRDTIVVVPVRPVERDPVLGNVQHPGYAGEVEAVGGDVAVCHVPRGT